MVRTGARGLPEAGPGGGRDPPARTLLSRQVPQGLQNHGHLVQHPPLDDNFHWNGLSDARRSGLHSQEPRDRLPRDESWPCLPVLQRLPRIFRVRNVSR